MPRFKVKHPKRNYPVSAYIEHDLKLRAMRVAKRDPVYTVSRIIEECLVRGLPAIEREVETKNGKVA